ncbi:hypothetical protein TRV_02204, partial [Trichophyton verrucosum HKI 0517]
QDQRALMEFVAATSINISSLPPAALRRRRNKKFKDAKAADLISQASRIGTWDACFDAAKLPRQKAKPVLIFISVISVIVVTRTANRQPPPSIRALADKDDEQRVVLARTLTEKEPAPTTTCYFC